MIIGIDASRANQREKTGTEWYSWHLIRHLAGRLTDQTIKLYVREPLEPGLQLLGDHVQAVVLSWPPGILWSHLRLSWEMFWRRPDVLFVPADTVPLIHPRRTVTTIHDVAFERWPEFYRRSSVQRRLGWLRPMVHFLVRLLTLGRYSASEVDYHRWSVRHAIRTCPRILTVSEFTKREIISTLRAQPERITVTYQGVAQAADFARFQESERRQVRKTLGVSRPFWLYLGRLETKKNIGAVVKGYLQYRRLAASPADLVLVGAPGYGWSALTAELPDLARQGIHQLGWQPSEVVTVLQTAAVGFLFLSAYEGFGRPPLESMSAGVPVLANRQGSLPEVLGDCAAYCQPTRPDDVAQAMLDLETDESLRRRLIVCGLDRVRQFTWDRTATLTAAALTDWPALVKKR